MKKFLLSALTAVAALTSTNAFAQDEVIFGYIQDWPLSQFPLATMSCGAANTEITNLIYLPNDTVNKYAGYKVTGVYALSGTMNKGEKYNPFIDAELIFRYDRDGRSFNHQSIQFSAEPLVWNYFPLDAEVLIEEDVPFYCGWTGITPVDDCAPTVLSGMATSEDSNGCWRKLTTGWYNQSTWKGNLMFQMLLKKDTGVDAISNVETAQVFAAEGGVNLAGEFKNAAICDLQGRVVANVARQGKVSLTPGLYVVNFDNVKTTKVFVK